MEMVNVKWTILIISAITDTIITAATGLTTAMVVMGEVVIPSTAVILFSLMGGLIQGMRTMQQGLKTSVN